MKRFAVILLALVIACGTAGAQGMLKNIGGKVINKVEKKVENKAGQKVDKVLGKIFGEDPEQNASQAAQRSYCALDEEGVEKILKDCLRISK